MDHTHPRSFWLDEALAREHTETCPPLRSDRRADVCIVGGGYTGLWTALQLKAADSSLDVVLIERDLCASGASGRNAGVLMSWWSKFLSLRKVCGEEEALRLAQASEDAVSSVIELCKEHDIDAQIRQDGWLWAASNQVQVGLWNETIESIGRHGLSPIVEWSQAEIAPRSGTSQNSPHVAGAYESKVATVQPALLGRGLRQVALDQGVVIFEKTPLVSLNHTNPVVIKTPEAKITADKVSLSLTGARWSNITAPH